MGPSRGEARKGEAGGRHLREKAAAWGVEKMGSFKNIWKVESGGFSSLMSYSHRPGSGQGGGDTETQCHRFSPGEEPRESPSFSQGSGPMAVLLLILTVAL